MCLQVHVCGRHMRSSRGAGNASDPTLPPSDACLAAAEGRPEPAGKRNRPAGHRRGQRHTEEELHMEVVLHMAVLHTAAAAALHTAAAAERYTAAAHRQAGSHWGRQAAPHERQALAAGSPLGHHGCLLLQHLPLLQRPPRP